VRGSCAFGSAFDELVAGEAELAVVGDDVTVAGAVLVVEGGGGAGVVADGAVFPNGSEYWLSPALSANAAAGNVSASAAAAAAMDRERAIRAIPSRAGPSKPPLTLPG
jgi:hypothetical protein